MEFKIPGQNFSAFHAAFCGPAIPSQRECMLSGERAQRLPGGAPRDAKCRLLLRWSHNIRSVPSLLTGLRSILSEGAVWTPCPTARSGAQRRESIDVLLTTKLAGKRPSETLVFCFASFVRAAKHKTVTANAMA